MKTSTLWLWVFSLLAACLPPKAALDDSLSDIEVLAVAIHDGRGASWPLDAIPRVPQIDLALSARVEQPEKRLWLLEGRLDEALSDDLLDPPLRADNQARLVEVQIESQPEGLRIATSSPLLRGHRYCLVVLVSPDRLWSRELLVSESPSAGAAFLESLPADRARGVPPNLAAMTLRFDGYLAQTPVATLRAGDVVLKTKVSTLRCSELGLAEGDCVRIEPIRTLPKQTELSLVLENMIDSAFASLPNLSFGFETAEGADTQAPLLSELTCALDERPLDGGGCVLEQDRTLALRLTVDEPVLATLRTENQTRSALSFGRNIEIALTDLKPERALPSTLTLKDLAGHASVHALGLETASPLATMSIDEVRCDPLGPEPAQEIIELLNFGGEPIQITGFSVSDDALEPGVRIRDALSVLPGERVLVVGPDFDARDTSDGALAPGVRLARTDKTLSLNNQGTFLYLRDAQNHRLSAAPRMKPLSAGACIARIDPDPRAGALSSFAHDPNQSCTPGTETRWP